MAWKRSHCMSHNTVHHTVRHNPISVRETSYGEPSDLRKPPSVQSLQKRGGLTLRISLYESGTRLTPVRHNPQCAEGVPASHDLSPQDGVRPFHGYKTWQSAPHLRPKAISEHTT